MQTTDREEFEAQLAILCAGKNVPVTQARKDAYWRGMGRMTLAQFARCVDYALSEWPEEGMPSTSQLWTIHRSFRARAPAQVTGHVEDTRDHLLFFANRMFFRHLNDRGGLGSSGHYSVTYARMEDVSASAELTAARTAIRDLVDYWRGPVEEGDSDATPAEFIRQFIDAVHRVSPLQLQTRAFWEANRLEPQSAVPFPRYMGRALESRYGRNDSQRALIA